MSRLTMKLDEPIKTKYLNYEYNRIPDYDIVRGNFGRISDDMIFNKLGKLEDLEDELECPLEVVFKALKDGIYHEFGDLLYDGENLKLHHIKKQGWGLYPIICDYDEAEAFLLKDYKKTWWLSSDLEE